MDIKQKFEQFERRRHRDFLIQHIKTVFIKFLRISSILICALSPVFFYFYPDLLLYILIAFVISFFIAKKSKAWKKDTVEWENWIVNRYLSELRDEIFIPAVATRFENGESGTYTVDTERIRYVLKQTSIEKLNVYNAYCGRINNNNFSLQEVKYFMSDPEYGIETILFEGTAVLLDNPKSAKLTLAFRDRSQKSIDSFGLGEIKSVDHFKFSQKYSVFCNNINDAFTVLTPSLMDKIAENYDNLPIREVVFFQNRVCIFLDKKFDVLTPLNFILSNKLVKFSEFEVQVTDAANTIKELINQLNVYI